MGGAAAVVTSDVLVVVRTAASVSRVVSSVFTVGSITLSVSGEVCDVTGIGIVSAGAS